ncbi:olfactory receptor 7A10-like, partial [Ursus americanus]|uniref:olfactory receptor 7A10-like n=1 Tax=Ursus americanus TaxID=9643 RepID=UPI001E679EBA
DICLTSTTIPKMLWNIQVQEKTITYAGCISQIFFFDVFGFLEDLLLTVMAYDRLVAICHPLHYTVIMNRQLCGLLVLVSWIISVLNSLLQSLMLLRLSFCTGMEIPHFFCELNQVVGHACSDAFVNDMVMYFGIVVLGCPPVAGVLYSYSKIVSSICGISSAQGKYKAFSTCASHLSLVSLFYCTVLGVYISSAANQSSHASAVASVMYTVVTPMMVNEQYRYHPTRASFLLRNLFPLHDQRTLHRRALCPAGRVVQSHQFFCTNMHILQTLPVTQKGAHIQSLVHNVNGKKLE